MTLMTSMEAKDAIAERPTCRTSLTSSAWPTMTGTKTGWAIWAHILEWCVITVLGSSRYVINAIT